MTHSLVTAVNLLLPTQTSAISMEIHWADCLTQLSKLSAIFFRMNGAMRLSQVGAIGLMKRKLQVIS
jgi:hypothetical protein